MNKTDVAKLLHYHAEKYPLMQPIDAIKLLYQSEFGCGHFVEAGKAYERLKNEYATAISLKKGETFVDIGEGRSRLMLSSDLLCEDDIPLVSSLFAASAAEDLGLEGSSEGMKDKLAEFLREAENGVFPSFNGEDAEKCFREYLELGMPAVSHSEIYRKAYAPAYRVMSRTATRVFYVALTVSRMLKKSENILLAIDGRACSGKSTAADFLYGVFDCNIIHADDFFLPFERKTPERLSSPGGNIDYERLSEVLEKAGKEDFSYRPFECSKNALGDEKCFIHKPLTIVEGSYSMHPALIENYSFCVFSDISEKEQLQRLKLRSPNLVERFVNEWIPMEEAYANAFSIREKADIII